MKLDPNSLIFVVKYYETLANHSESIENVYNERTRLVVCKENRKAKVVVSRYLNSLFKSASKGI
jgi:archaellum component FlaF (FlaF/FlaG flagellin family)